MEFTVHVEVNGVDVFNVISIDIRAFSACCTKDEIIAKARSIYQKENPNAYIVNVVIGRVFK